MFPWVGACRGLRPLNQIILIIGRQWSRCQSCMGCSSGRLWGPSWLFFLQGFIVVILNLGISHLRRMTVYPSGSVQQGLGPLVTRSCFAQSPFFLCICREWFLIIIKVSEAMSSTFACMVVLSQEAPSAAAGVMLSTLLFLKEMRLLPSWCSCQWGRPLW